MISSFLSLLRPLHLHHIFGRRWLHSTSVSSARRRGSDDEGQQHRHREPRRIVKGVLAPRVNRRASGRSSAFSLDPTGRRGSRCRCCRPSSSGTADHTRHSHRARTHSLTDWVATEPPPSTFQKSTTLAASRSRRTTAISSRRRAVFQQTRFPNPQPQPQPLVLCAIQRESSQPLLVTTSP